MTIGVAMEVVVIVIEYRHELHAFNRGIIRPPDKPIRWLFGVGLLGAGLVAIGVAGEFGAHIKAGKIESDMRIANRQLVAIVNDRAAAAERDAANAHKEAEDERMARVQIEEAIAPRRLTTKQRSAIGLKLLRFSPQRVFAIHHTLDVEAGVLAAEILSTLKSAKWYTNDPHWAIGGAASAFVRAPSIPVTGILISAAPDTRSQLAARALSRELSSHGFDCRIPKKSMVGFGPRSENEVVIDVEARPEGPQGEAKLRADAKRKQQARNQTTSP